MTPISIMINGLPGNMARILAETALADPRFTVLPYSLTGPEIQQLRLRVGDQDFQLISPGTRDDAIKSLIDEHGTFISVDYTHPSAVNDNCSFYCRRNLPFVMGTTGGDRRALQHAVEHSPCSAVIAPNMAKQIVGFQAMMQYAARNFPGLFRGYAMELRESHQQGKADTSGTAKAMVAHFNDLGIDFATEDIVKERNPEHQRDSLGVPGEHLTGHAWHTYTLSSADGTVRFEFTHNVNGRLIYTQGTLDAVVFLRQRVAEGSQGQVFSMIDVIGKPN